MELFFIKSVKSVVIFVKKYYGGVNFVFQNFLLYICGCNLAQECQERQCLPYRKVAAIKFKKTMKKISKGIISLIVLGCFCTSVQVLLNSCQNEKNDLAVSNEKSKTLLKDFVFSGQDFATKPIVNNCGTKKTDNRRKAPKKSQHLATISVDFPSGTNEEAKKLLNEVQTMEDLIELRRFTNATYTYDADVSTVEHFVEVSKTTVMEVMNPMIEKSKKFLKEEKGFTEAEIQEMLAENNVDESQLVPLVALICEDEAMSGDRFAANRPSNFNLLATPCYASNKIVWCAVAAIFGDLAYAAHQSGLKTWSKALIKSSFKTIAKRALGPIGAAIAVAEFAVCMS